MRICWKLVASTVLVIGLVLCAAAMAVLPIRSVGQKSGGPEVADVLLLIGSSDSMRPRPALTGIGVFRPQTGSFDPLLDTLFEPTASIDGRDLFFVQERDAGQREVASVVDIATDTLEVRWSVDLLDIPLVDFRQHLYEPLVAVASTADQVFVAAHASQSLRPITLLALDRADGSERRRWQADVGDLLLGQMQVTLAPGADTLNLVAVETGRASRVQLPPAEVVLFRFRLPDAQQESPTTTLAVPDLRMMPWPPIPVPDGRTLYGLAGAYAGRSVSVDFFDLGTTSIERLDLPLVARGIDWVPYEPGISADGRYLYVLAPSLSELVVVDLIDRRIQQTVALDMTPPVATGPSVIGQLWGFLGDLLVAEAEAKTPFVGMVQLSADGTRLYAAGIGHDSRGAGVLVIDTRDWRLIDQWLSQVEPAEILLSADGRQLFVQEPPWGVAPTAGAVHVLDVTSGAELSASQSLPGARLLSLDEIYRTALGRAPTRQQARPQQPIAPLATLRASIKPRTTVPGRAVQIDAEFIDADARTREPVQLGQSDVRYEAPMAITAQLVRSGSADEGVSVRLEPSGSGAYRGLVALPPTASGSTGSWSLGVQADWSNGLERRSEVPDAIIVQPTFTGTDGRAYVLQLTSDPPQPHVDYEMRLEAAFVDADTGARLPAAVNLVDGLPDRLEIACYGQGVTTRPFAAVGHGTYAGSVNLWAPGDWQVWATLAHDGAPSQTFIAGSLHVGS